MSEVLSIVQWERYQHYKDRDPPWIKLYRDMLTAESWVLGTDTSRLVQVAIMMLAARYSNQIPLQWTLIRKVASLDCSETEFRSALSHLAEQNFLAIQSVTETGQAVVHHASTALALARSREAEAEAEAEAEQRQKRSTAAAPPTANGDDAGQSRKRSPRTDSDDEGFAQFRSLYPPRNGDQRWKRAREAINARLREGATWEQILDGTRRYAAWCEATAKIGTEHVKQAATFVGPEKPFLEPWHLPASKADRRMERNLSAGAEAKRQLFGGGTG